MTLRTATRLAIAAMLVAAGVAAVRSCGSRPPNVLLITVDTLRADHLHCYGQALPTSPNIDALAARSVVFERAIAASSYTGPAHASMMTSKYPRRQSTAFSNGLLTLAGVDTLADVLRRSGYDTAAFVSNGVLAARSGLNRGFDVYDDELPTVEQNRFNVFERLAPQTAGRALAWLEQPRTKPFFLWVHLQDPHGPYTPPEPYRDRFRLPTAAGEPELRVLDDNGGQGGIPAYQVLDGARHVSDYRGRYAGEIAYMDHSVGDLLAALERYGPTIVVVTADHGESFGEDGFYFAHGHSTAPDLSHVPLIINAPGLRHERRADPVSHVDLMPTLLELTGRPVPGNVDGIALGPLLRTHVAVPARAVFCDIGYEVAAYGPEDFLVAATPQPKSWTLEVFYQEGHAAREHAIAGSDGLTVMQTFNWDGGPTWTARDPAPDLAARLASYLEGSSVIGDPVPLSPADRERLRSLGYGSR